MQLLAAFEAELRAGAKDQAEWSRIRSQLYAPPRDGPARRPADAPATGMGRLTSSDAAAMVARMAAADAAYGR